MTTEILLLIIIIELAIMLFFNFQKLPVKSIRKLIEKVGQAENRTEDNDLKSEIMEWQPTSEKEKEAFEKLLKKIKK